MSSEFPTCCLLCSTGSVQDTNSLKYLRDKYKLAPIFIKLFGLPQDPYEEQVGRGSLCPDCCLKLEKVQDFEKKIQEIKCDIEQRLFEAHEGQEKFVHLENSAAGELIISPGDVETRSKICSVILRNSSRMLAQTQEIQMEQQQMIKIEHFNSIDTANIQAHTDQMDMNYDWGMNMNMNDQQAQNNVTQLTYSYHQQQQFADPFVRIHGGQYDGQQLVPEISNSNQEFQNFPQIVRTISRNPDGNFDGNFENNGPGPSVSSPAAGSTTTTCSTEVIVAKRGRGRPRKDGTSTSIPIQKKITRAASRKRKI